MNILIALFRYLFRKNTDITEMEYVPLAENPIASTTPIVEVPTPASLSPSEKLYAVAKASLGIDASPRDVAPDEYGCAESVNELFKKTFGHYITNPGISTAQLYLAMLHDVNHFQIIKFPVPGAIIISPTGYGNGRLSNGHVGICGKFGIMSNSSATGKWSENYTLDAWIAYYKTKGGFPVVLFRPV